MDVTDAGFSRTVTHSGSNDDYDMARGPSRSLTARSDKALTRRDMRMPTDLTRSRRVGLRRTTCAMCHAVNHEGVTQHAYHCPVVISSVDSNPAPLRRIETTGPMEADKTSADVGWR